MEKRQLPSYVKYFIVLASLTLTVYIVITLKSIIVPIALALIISLLLKPLTEKLEVNKFPRMLACIISIIVFAIVIIGILTFFSMRVKEIAGDMESIEKDFKQLTERMHTWAENTLGIESYKQDQYIKESAKSMMQSGTSYFGRTISATTSFFTGVVLFILSLFFFLYYRCFFKDFLFRVFNEKNHERLSHVIHKTEKVVRQYLLGLGTVILIIAVLNSAGLALIGIDHAIFFGALAAILTIIPYVGVFIGSIIPVLFALVTTDSIWYPIGVALLFWGVQFLEGNFITPNIIGNNIRVNPYAIILSLFLGGIALGPAGMILAIPSLAIIKVICDNIPDLNSFGFLIGEPPKKK